MLTLSYINISTAKDTDVHVTERWKLIHNCILSKSDILPFQSLGAASTTCVLSIPITLIPTITVNIALAAARRVGATLTAA